MSYTRTITSNGNSISQEGGQSFNQQLDDLQEQIEEGGGGSITDLGTSSGTANALAGASLVDTATTFTAGRLYRIRTNAANSGAATCSINGGTGVAMKKSPSSAALASGDIADATELLLYYDGTNLQVLSGLTVSADEMILAVPTTTRSSNAFSGDLPVAPASLATGLIIAWRVPSAPSGASTYNLNSLGAKDIYRGNAAAVAADLPANRDILMRYDGTQWQIVGFGTLTKLDMPFTGTPDGSKYLRDDQTWQAVSATDTSALALDGSRTMTGAVNMGSGSKAFWSASGTLSSTQYEATRTAGGTLFINAPSSGDIEIGNAGSGKLNVNSAGVRVLGTGGTGHFLRQTSSNGVISSAALTPSDMPYSAVGATFANDGNWYNLYSLAQGTHNGEIKIACALFGGLVTFTINGTSISLINDDWGGSYADTTAASGKIAFRVSGGYLQINVGTGISSTPRKFLAIFNGTVN